MNLKKEFLPFRESSFEKKKWILRYPEAYIVMSMFTGLLDTWVHISKFGSPSTTLKVKSQEPSKQNTRSIPDQRGVEHRQFVFH